MMDKDLTDIFYKIGMYSLALGTPSDVLSEMMEESANEDDFEQAQGYQLALTHYNSVKEPQNARVKPFTE